MVRTNPKYAKYIHITKSGRKLLFMQLDKALYGCLKSARRFYDLLRLNIEDMGFAINPYDNCVANKDIDGSQFTIAWHVDDLKLSHAKKEALKSVIEELKRRFGALIVTQGNEHVYVGMTIRYTDDGKVIIDASKYIKEAISDFGEDVSRSVNTPTADFLFEMNESQQKLNEKDREKFRSIVAKLLFVTQRGRPDILVAIAFLTTRVSKADKDGWKKLTRLMQYLNANTD